MDTAERTVTHIMAARTEDLSLRFPQRDRGLNPRTRDTQDTDRTEGAVRFIC